MNDFELRFTKHANKRYRQRVGGMPLPVLHRRSRTALQVGLYQKGQGVIKLCGVWWGYVVKDRQLILTTCYGKLEYNLINRRAKREEIESG